MEDLWVYVIFNKAHNQDDGMVTMKGYMQKNPVKDSIVFLLKESKSER